MNKETLTASLIAGGVLLFANGSVRAQLADMPLEPSLTSLIQVRLKVQVVEVSGDVARALGFDWLLGAGLVGLESSLPARSLGEGLAKPADPTIKGRGVLTEPQARTIMQALDHRQDVDCLTTLNISTLSSRPAEATLRNKVTVVGASKVRNVVSIDVMPTVRSDGMTIDLRTSAALTQISEDAVADPSTFIAWLVADGVVVYDGQTAVLGSPRKSPKPGSRPHNETTILIFVTSTLLDSAGNRVHPVDKHANDTPTQRAVGPGPDR